MYWYRFVVKCMVFNKMVIAVNAHQKIFHYNLPFMNDMNVWWLASKCEEQTDIIMYTIMPSPYIRLVHALSKT